MSRFLLAFDIDRQKDVLAAVRGVRGVQVAGMPQADGTVVVRTTTRSLDDETMAIRSLEGIPGVLDLRLLE